MGRFFKNALRPNDPLAKIKARELMALERAVDKMEVDGGYVDWNDGIPRIITDPSGSGSGAGRNMPFDCTLGDEVDGSPGEYNVSIRAGAYIYTDQYGQTKSVIVDGSINPTSLASYDFETFYNLTDNASGIGVTLQRSLVCAVLCESKSEPNGVIGILWPFDPGNIRFLELFTVYAIVPIAELKFTTSGDPYINQLKTGFIDARKINVNKPYDVRLVDSNDDNIPDKAQIYVSGGTVGADENPTYPLMFQNGGFIFEYNSSTLINPVLLMEASSDWWYVDGTLPGLDASKYIIAYIEKNSNSVTADITSIDSGVLQTAPGIQVVVAFEDPLNYPQSWQKPIRIARIDNIGISEIPFVEYRITQYHRGTINISERWTDSESVEHMENGDDLYKTRSVTVQGTSSNPLIPTPEGRQGGGSITLYEFHAGENRSPIYLGSESELDLALNEVLCRTKDPSDEGVTRLAYINIPDLLGLAIDFLEHNELYGLQPIDNPIDEYYHLNRGEFDLIRGYTPPDGDPVDGIIIVDPGWPDTGDQPYLNVNHSQLRDLSQGTSTTDDHASSERGGTGSNVSYLNLDGGSVRNAMTNGSAIGDSNGIASIDPNNRYLNDTSGNIIAEWAVGAFEAFVANGTIRITNASTGAGDLKVSNGDIFIDNATYAYNHDGNRGITGDGFSGGIKVDLAASTAAAQTAAINATVFGGLL